MQNRNISLDYFKLLLATLVITIHISPTNEILETIIGNGIARLAVPCFFVINGYFLTPLLSDKKRFVAYIKKIIIIYITWMTIYMGFHIEYFFDINSISVLLKKLASLLIGYGHIWYLGSLIPASILLFFLKNINKQIGLLLSFGLFIIGYLVYSSQLIATLNMPSSIQSSLDFLYLHKIDYVKNLFLMGFPFLYIGFYLYNNSIALKKGTHLILIITFLFALILESMLLSPLSPEHDYRLSLLILCPLLISLFTNNPTVIKENGFYSKLASAIYFIHPLIIHLLPHEYGSYRYIFIILIITSVFSIGLIELNKKVKIFL